MIRDDSRKIRLDEKTKTPDPFFEEGKQMNRFSTGWSAPQRLLVGIMLGTHGRMVAPVTDRARPTLRKSAPLTAATTELQTNRLRWAESSESFGQNAS